MKTIFGLIVMLLVCGCSDKKEDCKIPEEAIKSSLEHMRDEIYQCDELARCMGEKRGHIILKQEIGGFDPRMNSVSYMCMVRESQYKWRKPVKGQINLPSEIVEGKYFDLDKISSALEACEDGKKAALRSKP